MTVQCDAAGCKQTLHLSCAHAHLLMEKDDTPGMVEPYFVFCPKHMQYDAKYLPVNEWARWCRKRRKLHDPAHLIAIQDRHRQISRRLEEKVKHQWFAKELKIMDKDTAQLKAAIEEIHGDFALEQIQVEVLEEQVNGFMQHYNQEIASDNKAQFVKDLRRAFNMTFGSIPHWRQRLTELPLCSLCNEVHCANQGKNKNALVNCDRCEKHFHAHCLEPPLKSLPKKGQTWRCLPCIDQQQQENVEPALDKTRRRSRAFG